MSKFCTAVTCMDGRIQLPVIQYLQDRFNAEYVDTITEPGPNGILAAASDENLLASIEKRVRISVDKHASTGIAVVGHHDCAGNPTREETQQQHTESAVRWLREKFPGLPVIGLWVNAEWAVSEVVGAEE